MQILQRDVKANARWNTLNVIYLALIPIVFSIVEEHLMIVLTVRLIFSEYQIINFIIVTSFLKIAHVI